MELSLSEWADAMITVSAKSKLEAPEPPIIRLDEQISPRASYSLYGFSVGFAARIYASVSVGIVKRLSTLVSLKYP